MNMLDATIVDDGGPRILLNCGMRLTLSGPLADAAAPYVGKAVAFGIRPENLKFADASTPADWPVLNLPVDLVEGMGAENLVHFALGRRHGGRPLRRDDTAARGGDGRRRLQSGGVPPVRQDD